MTLESEVYVSLYAYKANDSDSSILSFSVGDYFLLVKVPEADSNWLWVCDQKAFFGYVPANFVKRENLSNSCLARVLTEFMTTIKARYENESTDAKNKKHLQHEISKLKRKLQQMAVSAIALNAGPEVRVRFQDEDESMASSRLESLGRVCASSSSRPNSRTDRRTPSSLQTSNEMLNSILKHQMDKSPSPEPRSKVITPSTSNTDIQNATHSSNLTTKPTIEPKSSIPNCNGNVSSKCSEDNSSQTSNESQTTSSSITNENQYKRLDDEFESTLINQTAIELLQQLRSSSDLPYNQCEQVLFQTLKCLQRLPACAESCQKIVAVLCDKSNQLNQDAICRQSQDFEQIDRLLQQLRPFAKDTQQHNWPCRRDEGCLSDLLQTLHSLLHRANPIVVTLRIRQNDYECVHEWIEHVQEERQPLVRLWLHRSLLLVTLLDSNGVTPQLLGSGLPVHLTNQLIKQISALKSRARRVRWLAAARLYTITLSSGQEPCSGLVCPIDRNAIEQLLTLIQDINDESSGTNEQLDDQQLDAINNHHEDQADTSKLTMDDLVNPLLAFNLRFGSEQITQNPLLTALVERPEIAALLLPHLALQLNWMEDPTSLNFICNQVEQQFQIKLPEVKRHSRSTVYEKNAVLKLLIEMFAIDTLALAMYVNDVSVLIDIVVTHLNNLQVDDENRIGLARLLLNVLKNSSYRQESVKINEVQQLIANMVKSEQNTSQERELARQIQQLLTNSN